MVLPVRNTHALAFPGEAVATAFTSAATRPQGGVGGGDRQGRLVRLTSKRLLQSIVLVLLSHEHHPKSDVASPQRGRGTTQICLAPAGVWLGMWRQASRVSLSTSISSL